MARDLRVIGRLGRLLSLVLLAVLGTSALVYCAPGYFSDAREMDAAHADLARGELDRMHQQQASLGAVLYAEVRSWSHGDLGASRQYWTPVSGLLRERSWRSFRLLTAAVALGWAAALLLAVPLSVHRRLGLDIGVAALTSILLAVPVGAMATLCLVTNCGGPVLVLALAVAVRDLKLLQRTLRAVWIAPHLLHARAQGLSTGQILATHVFPPLRREVFSMGVMSFTLALSALVPVEVIFDYPGLGQLAWSAAMNRDLPVLTAVTAVVAAAVGIASLFVEPARVAESTQCV